VVVLGEAIDVEHGVAAAVVGSEDLRVDVADVGDGGPFSLEHGVEEADEDVLVGLCAEEFLEPEVRVGVHEFFLIVCHNTLV